MKEYNWNVHELETLTPMEMSIHFRLLVDELKRKKEQTEK